MKEKIKIGKQEIEVKEKKKGRKKKIKEKVAKVLNHGAYKRYLYSINPYLQTLMDPWGHPGVKIPDVVTTPSSTFRSTYRQSLTIPTNGICLVIVGVAPEGSVPNLTEFGSLVPYLDATPPTLQYGLGGVLVGTGLAAAPFQTGAAFVNFTLPNVSNIVQNYTQVRLVSAGCSLVYTGADLSNQGVMTSFSEPRCTIRPVIPTWTNTFNPVPYFQQLRSSKIASVSKSKGVMCVYQPIDTHSSNYVAQYDKYTDVITFQDAIGCEMGFLISGAASGATFQFEYIGNYEGIPSTNALDIIQATPSKSDPIEYSEAINKVSEVIPTAVCDNKAPLPESGLSSGSIGSTKATEAHPVQQESSMLDRMFEGLNSGVGFATDLVEKGSKLAEKVGPLAAMIL